MHDDKIDFGYNVNVAATDSFIREVVVATGAQPDPVTIPDLLLGQQIYHGVAPPKFICDVAAGAGKYFAKVAQLSAGQTQLVAPLIAYNQSSERFGPDGFVLAADDEGEYPY